MPHERGPRKENGSVMVATRISAERHAELQQAQRDAGDPSLYVTLRKAIYAFLDRANRRRAA